MGRLGHTGSSVSLRRELFPGGFATEVMQIIWETWRDFAMNHDVKIEPRITALFRASLIDAYVAAGRSWFITLEDPVTDPIFGTEAGRNDLNFFPPQHFGQRVFFTVECKRLNVTTNSGFSHKADQYVTAGVQRFVDGKYSEGLPCGGMLGYVMDAHVGGAFKKIESELKARTSQLKISSKSLWSIPSSVLPKCPTSADTKHDRSDGQFLLHHLLVGVVR